MCSSRLFDRLSADKRWSNSPPPEFQVPVLDESTDDCRSVHVCLLVVIELVMRFVPTLLPFASSIRLVARHEHTPFVVRNRNSVVEDLLWCRPRPSPWPSGFVGLEAGALDI